MGKKSSQRKGRTVDLFRCKTRSWLQFLRIFTGQSFIITSTQSSPDMRVKTVGLRAWKAWNRSTALPKSHFPNLQSSTGLFFASRLHASVQRDMRLLSWGFLARSFQTPKTWVDQTLWKYFWVEVSPPHTMRVRFKPQAPFAVSTH